MVAMNGRMLYFKDVHLSAFQTSCYIIAKLVIASKRALDRQGLGL
jgi:hypothetical protein